jgi:hypothetical protein
METIVGATAYNWSDTKLSWHCARPINCKRSCHCCVKELIEAVAKCDHLQLIWHKAELTLCKIDCKRSHNHYRKEFMERTVGATAYSWSDTKSNWHCVRLIVRCRTIITGKSLWKQLWVRLHTVDLTQSRTDIVMHNCCRKELMWAVTECNHLQLIWHKA